MSVNCSIVLVIVVGLMNMCVGVLDFSSVYVGQVDFEEVLATAGDTDDNQDQLDEVYTGFIGGPGSQLSEQQPTEFSDTAQAAVDNFVGVTTTDNEVNFPEFNDLLDSLSTFGLTKGSMEISIANEQIPLKDDVFDILNYD